VHTDGVLHDCPTALSRSWIAILDNGSMTGVNGNRKTWKYFAIILMKATEQ
jgi:hypothetical protein